MKTKLIKLSKETNSELTEVFLRLQNNPTKTI
jgi:L-asparagine oxygenase